MKRNLCDGFDSIKKQAEYIVGEVKSKPCDFVCGVIDSISDNLALFTNDEITPYKINENFWSLVYSE